MKANKTSALFLGVLFLIALATVVYSDTATYSWTTSVPGSEAGANYNITTYTVATNTVTNLFASVPLGHYRQVIIHTSGLAYLNGTTSTPTSGLPLAADKVIVINAPVGGQALNCIASTSASTVKVIGIK